MRKLPSLKLLVAFESAARHLSFKAAASELFVTPSAISHQVRILEGVLHAPLFERSNRSIELTQHGAQYFKDISPALAAIRRATEALLQQGHDGSLTLHSIPYLTNAFLVPNIRQFKARHPQLTISIESKTERAQLNDPFKTGLHVALRHGKEAGDEVHCEAIAPVQIAPVCAPHYRLDQPLTQLRLTTDASSWAKWQSEWGNALTFHDTLSCDGMHAVVEMAEQGLGITMGYFPFIADKVQKGQLTTVCAEKMTHFDALYLVCPKQDENNPIVADLLAWLRATLAH